MKTYYLLKAIRLSDILTKKEILDYRSWLSDEHDFAYVSKNVLDSNLEYLKSESNENIEQIINNLKDIINNDEVDYFLF